MMRFLRATLAGESAAALLALVIVVVVFAALNQRFLSPLILNGMVVHAAILSVAGIGMTLVVAMRSLDLSIGSIMGLSSILAAQLLVGGMPMAVVLPVGLAVGALLGLGNGLLITLLRLPSFVATLATFSMILGLELIITHGETVAIHSPLLNRFVVGNVAGVIPAAALEALVVLGLVWVIFHRTPFGRHVAAIGGDMRAAVGAGINVPAVTILTFVLVGMCAALAGLMTGAEIQNVDSTVGVGAELTAIAVVVVGGTSLSGGRGNLLGTVYAALLLSAIKSGLNIINVSSLYEDLAFGSILLLALVVDGHRRGLRQKGMLAA